MAVAVPFRTKNENDFCALRTVQEMHPLFLHSSIIRCAHLSAHFIHKLFCTAASA